MRNFLILITLFIIIGCESGTPKNVGPKAGDPVVSIGHGVYYFGVKGQEFGIQLAKFKTAHTIIAITSDNRSAYGATKGYFVVTDEE